MEFVLGKGDNISFWRNKWYDYEKLSLSFPKTYDITSDKDESVKLFYRKGTFRIATLRDGYYRNQTEKTKIIRKLENNISIPENKDMPLWLWCKNGVYTAASCYQN